MSLSGNDVVSVKLSVILMVYASKRRVLYLIAVKQCMVLYNDIICIQVIFFGAFCKLSSTHCTCCSQSSMTHRGKTERSLTTKQRQLQMLSNQLLPTSFLVEEREFHSGKYCVSVLREPLYSTKWSYNTKYFILFFCEYLMEFVTAYNQLLSYTCLGLVFHSAKNC